MIKRISLLSTLLILQLLIIAYLLFDAGEEGGQNENALQYSFNPDSVSRLVISDGQSDDKESLSLMRLGDDWVLPDAHGFTVSKNLVSQLLKNISAVNSSWPVADTSESITRFELSDSNYQRRVSIFSKDLEVAGVDFYLGTSPGFRKIHLRNAGSDKVYSVNLNQLEFSVSADYWMDKSLLSIPGQIIKVEKLDAWTIEKRDDSWVRIDGNTDRASARGASPKGASARGASANGASAREASPKEDSAPDASVKATELVAKFASLRIAGLAKAADSKVIQAAEATFVYTVFFTEHAVPVIEDQVSADKESLPSVQKIMLKFYHRVDQDDYLLSSSGFPQLFRLEAFAAESLNVEDEYFDSMEKGK